MYRKKNKTKKNKIIIICIVVFCLIVGFVVNVVVTDRELTVFEKAIKDSVLTVQKIISYPIDFIIDKIDEGKKKNQMYDEYNDLKDKLAQYQKYQVENEELKKQLEEMKKLLDINVTLSEYTYQS